MFLGKSKIDCKKNIHIYFAYPKHVMMQHNGIGVTDLMNCHRFAYMNCHQIDWFSFISQPHRAAA